MRVVDTCKWCGTPFNSSSRRRNTERGRYCSKKCLTESREDKHGAKNSNGTDLPAGAVKNTLVMIFILVVLSWLFG